MDRTSSAPCTPTRPRHGVLSRTQPSRYSVPVTPGRARYQHLCSRHCCLQVVSESELRELLVHSKEDLLEGLDIPPSLDVETDIPAFPKFTDSFRGICDKYNHLRKPTQDGLPQLCPMCLGGLKLHMGRKPELGGAWIINVSDYTLVAF